MSEVIRGDRPAPLLLASASPSLFVSIGRAEIEELKPLELKGL
jgi:hypothetical protein